MITQILKSHWRYKLFASILLFAVLLTPLFLLIGVRSSKVSLSTDQVIDALSMCPSEESDKTYECMMPLLRDNIATFDFPYAFDVINIKNRTDLGVSQRCHTIMHSFGRMLYEMHQSTNDALSKCRSNCADGCTMGVMESLLKVNQNKHVTLKDVVKSSGAICNEMRGTKNASSNCYHGLGHGIVRLANYDYIKSLDICDLVRVEGLRECYSGVSMEIFTPTDDVHALTENADPYHYCNEFKPSTNRSVTCALYYPVTWKKWGHNFVDITKRCLAIPSQEVTSSQTGKYIRGNYEYSDKATCLTIAGRELAYVLIESLENPFDTVLPLLDQTNASHMIYGAIYTLDERGSEIYDRFCEVVGSHFDKQICEDIKSEYKSGT